MSYKRVGYTALAVLAGVALVVLVVWSRLVTREAQSGQIDRDLAKVIKEFNLRPLEVRQFEADPKFRLGQALFFDPILSGPRDVSCATCHLLTYGTSDGLPQSIGVHGEGLGPRRRLLAGTHVHSRNALDLWNRDNNAVRSLFWDGRVEVLDPRRRLFRSPLGNELPLGLDNALAVQALFPLVTVDEMLGEAGDRSAADLPAGQAGLRNDLVSSNRPASEASRIKESHSRLMKRLLGGESRDGWQEKYRLLFREAYSRKNGFTIVDVGNAIAHYEEMAFATRDSAWDHYLRGDSAALSLDARRGAFLFYGKGRCAVCHAGPLFSDFKYHSIGVFQAGSSNNAREDFGRWSVTRREEDRYKFRTPPLRNVTKTAPYFHNGSEPSLKGAIKRHLEPLDKAGKYNSDGSFAMSIMQIDAISAVLLPKLQLSDREVDYLLTFLSALDFQPTDLDVIVPKTVPSGLPVAYQ